MSRAFTSLLALAFVLGGARGAAAEPVPESIRQQAGCFKVTYRFMEAGRPAEEPISAKEWIALDDKDPAAVKLTHVGIFGSDPMWHFQDVWSKRPDGAWRLQVLGRGGPRYTCEGKFVAGRLHCRAPGAAKPMRDKERKDYDKLDRGISLQVGPKAWAQQEYNDKVKNDGTLVAVEVGLVEYQRLEDSACAAAVKNPPKSPL
jgi:hypothetical protein